MATRGRTNQDRQSTRKVSSGKAPSPYEKELEDTFRLFDTDRTGRLSFRKVQLAMRTLGFEATIDDLQEIIENTPSLGIHQRKKKQQQQQQKGRQHSSDHHHKGKAKKSSSQNASTELQGAQTAASVTRQSSRAAVVASRSGSSSKYVGSDDDDDDDDDDGFESVDEDDLYKDEFEDDLIENPEKGQTIGDCYDDPLFTLDDFLAIMAPNEDEFAQDEVSRAFQLFDTQGRETIRLEDLRRVISKIGLRMTDDELREMIEEADPSGKGGVDETAFKDIMGATGLLEGPDS
ncbi:MAG: hypothetical protein J3Q66DRAFT_357463 [Benniella sp.]|nr:MAG: hypothetical protein J3Q66DRAFT_357463 [Benniella sp.]